MPCDKTHLGAVASASVGRFVRPFFVSSHANGAAMPRADAAKLIADNLHSLPHPSGRPTRLMHFSQFGHGKDTRQRIAKLAGEIGEATVHLLERGGYTLTHRDDPKPADADDYKTARIKCLGCGKELLRIGVNEQMVATLGRLALKSLAQIPVECPHE